MKIEKLSLALMDAKPNARRHAEQVFNEHYEELKAALSRNVSHKELLKILATEDVKMSLAKFKRMLELRERGSQVSHKTPEATGA